MIALTARLNERDEQILTLQEELEAYDVHQKCDGSRPPCHCSHPLVYLAAQARHSLTSHQTLAR